MTTAIPTNAFIALVIIAVIFVVAILINFTRLLLAEKPEIVYPKVQILSLRVAAMVPMFAIISLFGYVWPESLDILEAVEAWCEGYCIYCYFKFLTFYIGGKSRIIKLIQDSPHRWWCLPFQSSHPGVFYDMLKILISQFLFLRPFLVLIAGIADMLTGRSPLFVAFTALYIISLVAAMAALIISYHLFGEHTKPLLPLRKILFIKGYIVVLVVQNVVVNFISLQRPELKTTLKQIYSFAVCGELFILSFFLQSIFLSRLDTNVDEVASLSQDQVIMRGVIREESYIAFAARVSNLVSVAFDKEAESDAGGQALPYTKVVEVPPLETGELKGGPTATL